MSSQVIPAGWLGNVKAGRTLRFMFNSQNTAGEPASFDGTPPTFAIYKDASDTQDTDGITFTIDADGVAGLNRVLIDLSADGTFYSAGSDFVVVINSGIVDGGAQLAGTVVATFSIENRTIAGQGGDLTTRLNLTKGLSITSDSGETSLEINGPNEAYAVRILGTDTENGNAAVLINNGAGTSGAGVSVIGGPTGAGVTIAGGATSGNGVSVTATDGHALHLDGAGSNKNDLNLGTPLTNILEGVSATAPTGPATTFRGMVIQTWRRFFKDAVRDRTAETIVTYADDGTTPITTQDATDDGTTETQGPAT